MPPRVDVLVINWNGLEHLEACFDALRASTYPHARYVLVDNASTDGSVEFVRTRYGGDPRVSVLACPGNLGWSGGNNLAMRRAIDDGADYLLLLNNDTAIAPEAIARLVADAEAGPAVGALAPKLVMYDAPEILNSVGLYCSAIGASWDIGIGRLDGPRWDAPAEVIGVCGAAWLIRTAALARTGLLPEEFGIYLDDLDLSLRIWNAGYTVRSCPGAVVRHKFSATWGADARVRHKYFLNTRNRFWLMLRLFPASRLYAILPRLVIGECRAIGRALLDGEPWRAAAHLRAYAAALAYLPRAWRARRAFARAGIGPCRFWGLIHRGRMFSPGVEMPQRGWYVPQRFGGRMVRPMSRRAVYDSAGGALRIFHAACYPALGPIEIAVRQGDTILATLSTRDVGDCRIETAPGEVVFEALRLFDAEATGLRYDCGGWLEIRPGAPHTGV